jgi:tripartite-type tricarboxylate transporter receptor subunit TctC
MCGSSSRWPRHIPGKLNFAISGIGGAPHLAGIEFAQRTGVNWTYIPYKGGSDAVTGVVGGQAHVLFNGMLATWPSVTGRQAESARQFRAALGFPRRRTRRPSRARTAGFETGSFQAILGPAGIARETVAKLNGGAQASPEYCGHEGALCQAGHGRCAADTPQQLGDYLRVEKARWAKVVKDSGAKFE